MPRHEPGQRVSEYVLEHMLGAGSFAEVWQARHHIWESERVAVKLPSASDYVRYLQREGVLVHGLRHPNVVRVLGLDPYADVPYLIMELVRGPSLGALIEQHPKGLSVALALTILRGVLKGLGAAHAANVLHRDLKPGNILLDLRDRALDALQIDDVKVSDFGLGSGGVDAARSIAQSASLDRDSKLVGTLAYLAPELRDGGATATPRSDLFAVGIVLFELLTGQRPAGAEYPSTLRSDVPGWLDEVFRKLYARAERRYESAAAVLDDLNRHAPPLPPVPVPVAPALPPVPRIAAEAQVDPHAPLPAGAARFRYQATDAAGQRVGAEIVAQSPADAATQLERAGLKAESVQRVQDRCPRCDARPEPGDNFCIQCGHQLVAAALRCNCGAYPGANDRYCMQCGASLPLAEA